MIINSSFRNKFIFLVGLMCFSPFTFRLFPQTTETLTITTYYPSPFGVYQNLRLFPSAQPACNAAGQEGTMYYDNGLRQLMICTQTAGLFNWQPVGSSFWTLTGNSLYPNNNNWNVAIGTNSNIPATHLSIANGISDPTDYGRGIQITNANGNSQQIAFIRNGNDIVSAGYQGASHVWGFGPGQVTDSNFNPSYLSIDAGNNGNVAVGGFIAANGSSSITGNPPAASTNLGWRLGLWDTSYAEGIASWTYAVKTGTWFSIFGGNPANSASASSPDSNARVTLGINGDIYLHGLPVPAAKCTFDGTYVYYTYNPHNYPGQIDEYIEVTCRKAADGAKVITGFCVNSPACPASPGFYSGNYCCG